MSGAIARRDALRAAALGAGALALGGLARPAGARAQSEEVDALRDFLAEAVAREQIGVLAYALALDARGVNTGTRRAFERLRDQEQAHANAFRSALDGLGFDPPERPEGPDDSGVHDDVDGIDDETATALSELLARLHEPRTANQWIVLNRELEAEQIRFYAERAPELDSEDLAKTSAEIAASQAQHLVLLAALQGRDQAAVLADVERLFTGRGK